MTSHSEIKQRHTPGLRKNFTTNLNFTLILDVFETNPAGIKHVNDSIINLNKKYEITINQTGTFCAGVALDQDYENHILKVSFPGHTKNMIINDDPSNQSGNTILPTNLSQFNMEINNRPITFTTSNNQLQMKSKSFSPFLDHYYAMAT